MERAKSCFWRGNEALVVPICMHAEIRSKFIENLRKKLNDQQIKHGIVLLEGGKSSSFTNYDTDNENIFRQESYFHYLFGVESPDYYGTIRLRDGETTLFMPRLPDSYKVWLGRIPSKQQIQRKYGSDAVEYVEDLYGCLEKDAEIFIMFGINSDSGLVHSGITGLDLTSYSVNDKVVYPVLMECRVIKTPKEISIIRYANKISSDAHIHVMKNFVPGSMEYQIEADFLHYIYKFGGCRHPAYTCICASGTNSAILHYGHADAPNNCKVSSGSLVLVDAGAEYHRYASDITRTWPESGCFSTRQRAIYEVVLGVRNAVFSRLRPGVSWIEVHLLALRVICERFLVLGLLRGELEELERREVACLFMPHGLGHLLGVDVHDVGGFPPDGPPRPTELKLKTLRCGRVLRCGMVLTVEPGIYFNWETLQECIDEEKSGRARYLVVEELKNYENFGGVRIEDNVLITENGYENLTSVPTSVEDIEMVMAQNVHIPKFC